MSRTLAMSKIDQLLVLLRGQHAIWRHKTTLISDLSPALGPQGISLYSPVLNQENGA